MVSVYEIYLHNVGAGSEKYYGIEEFRHIFMGDYRILGLNHTEVSKGQHIIELFIMDMYGDMHSISALTAYGKIRYDHKEERYGDIASKMKVLVMSRPDPKVTKVTMTNDVLSISMLIHYEGGEKEEFSMYRLLCMDVSDIEKVWNESLEKYNELQRVVRAKVSLSFLPGYVEEGITECISTIIFYIKTFRTELLEQLTSCETLTLLI